MAFPSKRLSKNSLTDFEWLTSAETHQGMRRKINEDAILARPEMGLWVVADGMGGHEAGDVASKMVVESLNEMLCNAQLSDFVDQVEDLLSDINGQLRRYAEEHFSGRTMGCTMVGLLNRGRAGIAMWAGDSRLYRLRGGGLQQITRDHSPLEELVEKGVLSEEDAAQHPDANVITRAVGGQQELYLDIVMFDIESDDTYLLCSDGLYREMSGDEIEALLANDTVSLEHSVQGLLNLALERGARDNVSIIVCRAGNHQ